MHLERIVHVDASPAEVFIRLDQQTGQNSSDAVVTERVYPRRKAWSTRPATQRVVIDGYTMGYDVAAAEGGTRLKIWIDYAPAARFLAPLMAPVYARWRIDDLAQDAADSFTDMAAAIPAHP